MNKIPISLKPIQIPLITQRAKGEEDTHRASAAEEGETPELVLEQRRGKEVASASFISEGEDPMKTSIRGWEGRGKRREGRNSGESSKRDFLRLEFRIVEATLRPLGENRREETNETGS